MKELGLHRLGEYATLKQAPVSAFTALPRAYQRTKDNKEPFARSERELDLEAAVHRSVDEMTRRQSAPNTGKEGWSSRRASKRAKKIIRDLLDNEKQLRDFQKHGLIPTGSTDLLELNRSYKSLQRLESRATDNTMFWVFNIALDDNDMPNGVLGRLGLDGMYDKAEAEFKKIVAGRDFLPALVNLGNINYLAEDYAEALEFYERADNLRPDNTTVLLGVARASHQLEDYTKATANYDKLKIVDPALAEKFSYLGMSGESAARAADQAQVKKLMVWEEEE